MKNRQTLELLVRRVWRSDDYLRVSLKRLRKST
jgi:hypothetical protein